MSVRAYNPKNVIVSVGGVQISGFIDGEFILIARETDDTADSVGTDGEISVVLMNDSRHTATLTLAQTSQGNGILTALISSGPSLTTFAFLVQDLGGTTFVLGTAWIQRAADFGFSRDISERSWTLRVDVTQKLIGGNPLSLPV